MRRFLRRVLGLVVLCLLALLLYGLGGYRDARAGAEDLAARADTLLTQGRGGFDLGREREAMLLTVEDPTFYTHAGFDLTTPGAGATTITQSLSKREGFADWQPGLRKVRQTGYAIGLETVLSKPQIMALFLDSVPMGRAGGPDGDPVVGVWPAAEVFFGDAPAALTDDQFIALVAVMIAPGQLRLSAPSPQLEDRVSRIRALLSGACEPLSNGDVWLEGCAR